MVMCTFKHNSYTIAYLDNEGQSRFALIEYFVFIHNKVMAILTPLCRISLSCKDHFHVTTNAIDLVSFIVPVSVCNSMEFCFAQDMPYACFLILVLLNMLYTFLHALLLID